MTDKTSIDDYPFTFKLSAVIPTINEEKTIGGIIDELRNSGVSEIIIVDTNSTDRTRDIAREKGARIIEQPERGYGRAYKTGLNEVTGDIIICMDGDGTYPTNMVRPFVEILVYDQVDFISGDRMKFRTDKNYTTLHYVGITALSLKVNG